MRNEHQQRHQQRARQTARHRPQKATALDRAVGAGLGRGETGEQVQPDREEFPVRTARAAAGAQLRCKIRISARPEPQPKPESVPAKLEDGHGTDKAAEPKYLKPWPSNSYGQDKNKVRYKIIANKMQSALAAAACCNCSGVLHLKPESSVAVAASTCAQRKQTASCGKKCCVASSKCCMIC